MRLLFIFIIYPFLLFAQTDTTKGICFEQSFSWNQIKQKAKEENKYIFIDCYATWCKPCKEMDKYVYSNDSIGNYVNQKFISLKVQMDTSKIDNDVTKKWYADARALQEQYRIPAFPTYLFFSPEAKLVHKDYGFKTIEEFILLAKQALNPSQQYYTLLDNYKQGKKDYLAMAHLAMMAISLGDEDLGNIISKDYKNNYLDTVSTEMLFTKTNIDFINRFYTYLYADGSEGRFFKLFYHNADSVDKIMNRSGFANYYIENIIREEEVTQKLYKNDSLIIKSPDWEKIRNNIKRKYNEKYANILVLGAKVTFYRRMKDWLQYSKLIDSQIKNNPPTQEGKSLYVDGDGFRLGDPWALNVAAWDIFLHCNDKKILQKALQWSELSIKLEYPYPNPQYLDTKANLLYKMGKVKEAIACEKKAIEMDNAMAKKSGREKGGFFNGYMETIAKMKKGEPTWSVK